MLTLITPHLQLGSVLDLRVDHLRSLGLEGLLLDVDCTLKDYRTSAFAEPVVRWVGELRSAGLRLCLLSNGRPGRIGPLAESLGVPFIAKALKPFPHGCRRALGLLGLHPRQVAVIGDQLFADVLAGRMAGLFTILVQPTSPIEPWFTGIKRPLERQVLRWLKVRGPTGAGPVVAVPAVGT